MKIKKTRETLCVEEHSEYGASGSKKWLSCPGSIALSRGMPNYESEYALEGTQAHKCLEFLLRNRSNKAARSMALKTWNDQQVKHGMNTVEYVEELLWYWKVHDQPNTLHIETKIDASKFTAPGQFGTLDIAIDAKEHRTLIIGDYKYGAGIAVDPNDNSQLIYYALGMLLKLGWKNYDRIILIVMQPRAEHHTNITNRVWETTTTNILAWGKKFKAGVKAAEAPNAPLTSGEHCRFCLARIKCPKVKDEPLKQAQIDFSPSTNVIKKLPDLKMVDDIGKLLDACEKLQIFINAVKERAYNDAKRGLKVNGYKLVEKRTTRKWTNEGKAAAIVFKVLGGKAFTEPELLSPAQFEKKFKTLPSAMAFLNKNVTNKTGGTTLARVDSKKKAVGVFEAEFSVIEGDRL